MKPLSELLGSAFFTSNKKTAAPPAPEPDLREPKHAANFLIGWGWQNISRTPVVEAERQIVIRFLGLKGFQPSKDISADVLESYSAEKRQICFSLDHIKEHGTLLGKSGDVLRTLGETGKVPDSDMAKVQHGLDMEYAPMRR